MSLRGGLLAETTWALDTINIMLNDDQANVYLQFKQIPGLLQALVDIYVKCLTELFSEFKIENERYLSNSTKTNLRVRDENSVIYRIESNYLNKYRQKFNKKENIILEPVYDQKGNVKNNPGNVCFL